MLLRSGVNEDQQCSASFNLRRLSVPSYTFRPCFRECTAHVVATTEENAALQTMTNWKKKPTKITLMQKRCCIWPQISEQMVSEEGSPTARRQGWRHGQESCCVLWLKTSSHPTVELYLAMSLNTFLVPCTSPFSPILLLTMYSWLKWAQIAPWPEGQAGRDCLGKNAWDPLGEAYVI